MQNNEPETGGQPYEPFMFARKHGLSIDVARKILEEYGGDRAGSDAAAAARQIRGNRAPSSDLINVKNVRQRDPSQRVSIPDIYGEIGMTKSEYLVIERQNKWWVMVDGFRGGPYASRQIAIDSAVSAAKIDFRGGRPARVSVQNNTDMVTAYDSSPG